MEGGSEGVPRGWGGRQVGYEMKEALSREGDGSLFTAKRDVLSCWTYPQDGIRDEKLIESSGVGRSK